MRQVLKVLALAMAMVASVLATGASAAEPDITCSFVFSNAVVNSMAITVNIPDAPAGTKIATNFEQGVRPNEEFVFNGRTPRTGASTTVFVELENRVLEGDWDVKARWITPDGTRGDRVSCGIFNSADPRDPLIACSTGSPFGGWLLIEFTIENEVPGTRVVFNLRSTDGKRTYVFLGKVKNFRDDIMEVLYVVPAGEWEVEARWRNSDGTRGERVSCGVQQVFPDPG